ncbi:MAG: HAMP domain-containing protein [Desulfobacteraceae bacterium]|nr:HAMP domain-containing protein [Desulfobacteraceae bacterium]
MLNPNNTSFFSFVIIIFLAFLASLGFSIYFSYPIKKLENSVVEFGTGNYKHRAQITRHDELGDLAYTFNRITQEILSPQVFFRYIEIRYYQETPMYLPRG